MRNPEIILNLWFVQDEEDIIYSLRARAYVGQGSDEEKLDLLKTFASVDYLVAQAFSVPKAFHVRMGATGATQAVAYRSALADLDSPIAIFEEAIKMLDDSIPSQTDLQISAEPLVCITSLIGDEDGNLQPVIRGSRRL